jgi:maltose O-acetyltransferase
MKTVGGVFNNFLLMMDKNRMKSFYRDFDIHPTFKFGEYCYLYGDGEIAIGDNGYMGTRCSIYSDSSVSIGRRARIGHNVRMYTRAYVANQDMSEDVLKYHSGRIIIGNDVWIGINVYIGPNVQIGDNTVIGANCIVTKDVPSGVILKHSEQMIVPKDYQTRT